MLNTVAEVTLKGSIPLSTAKTKNNVMEKIIRVYVATQDKCEPCNITMETLGSEVNGAQVYEVDLTTNQERAKKMGVESTPTIFIVEVTDDNENGILEEIEEKHLYHQSGVIIDKTNLFRYVEILRSGGLLTSQL